MKKQGILNLRIKRILLYASRESLRFVNSWQMDPMVICLLFAAIFGTLGTLMTFIVCKKISYAILAGIFSVLANGFVMGSACMKKRVPLEIQQELFNNDQVIKGILIQRKNDREERRLYLETLRKEKDAEKLRIEQNKIEVAKQNEKEALIKKQNQADETRKREAILALSSANKPKYSNPDYGSKSCWHCSQKLFPGWIQCVFCKMIA